MNTQAIYEYIDIIFTCDYGILVLGIFYYIDTWRLYFSEDCDNIQSIKTWST